MSRTTIILSVIALVVLGAFYYFFFQGSDVPVVSLERAPGTTAEVTFIGLAAELGPIDFNTAVLDDPRFAALSDIKTAVIPEAAGRADPFAPLGR